MSGIPLTILTFNQAEKSFQDDSDVLKDLFLNENVKDRNVVIFSIVGSFRKGKSFFLDYCLRYLYANYDSLNRKGATFKKTFHWMGDQDNKLSGFSWRSGAERDTTGILFWSDVFLHTDDSGEKIAIFIIDTQGLFDNETTLMENSQIFALSSMMSSIQVINLNGNIREDELDYFQFAMEFGKLARKDGNESKEFQKVVFLIRDWQNPDDYDFGEIGGTKYLNHVLKLKTNQNDELNSVREFLSKSCEELTCYLLPHPGKLVAGRKDYVGQWAMMDEDFRFELFDAVESLLNSDRLVTKKVCGRKLSAENYFIHLKTYFKHFTSNDYPKITTMYKQLVEKDLNFLVTKAFQIYEDKLEALALNAKIENKFNEYFKYSKELAVNYFRNQQKLGDDNTIKIFNNQLFDMINKQYKKWKPAQLKILESQKAIGLLKNECEVLASSLANQNSKNDEKDKKILELKEKLRAEANETAKISKIYSKMLNDAKNKHQADLDAEKLANDLKLLKIQEKNSKMQEEIDELKSSNAKLQSRQSSKIDNSSAFLDICSQPAYNFGSQSCTPSTFSFPDTSSSSKCANPFNQHQKEYSSVWKGMSQSEKNRAGGNFSTASSRAYWAKKK